MIQQDIGPTETRADPCMFIGQTRSGQWVVRDLYGLTSAIFTNWTTAIRFAMYECQRRQQSVIMMPDGLELYGDLDNDSAAAKRRAS